MRNQDPDAFWMTAGARLLPWTVPPKAGEVLDASNPPM